MKNLNYVITLSCLLFIRCGVNPQLCIKNKNQAKAKAEKILIDNYGEEVINNEKPFNAKLIKGSIWYVKGTLHQQKGGVAHIKLDSKTCNVIDMYHEK